MIKCWPTHTSLPMKVIHVFFGRIITIGALQRKKTAAELQHWLKRMRDMQAEVLIFCTVMTNYTSCNAGAPGNRKDLYLCSITLQGGMAGWQPPNGQAQSSFPW